ncbi:MAG: hypoxanthine phosphoribosyltransferase [Oscillospiraceae bacterium]|nr:hypoxanthine phosphoribosyltransferase [Candidatus Equicaccousia limihippi]
MSIHNDICEVLFTKEQIEEIVSKLGKQITEDYKDKNLLIVGVLKGSVVFMADLIRQIDLKCKIDFMALSSYGNGTESSGRIRVLKDLQNDISGYDVLVIEDILDSGRTLAHLREMLKLRSPNSFKICTFFDKPDRRVVPDLKADYVGAIIPDKFIVGYGLDFAEEYRNLEYIGVLKPELYQ